MNDDDDGRSVEDHLRALQRRPEEQTDTRRVKLAEATVADHYEAIRTAKSYGPGGTLITDDTPTESD